MEQCCFQCARCFRCVSPVRAELSPPDRLRGHTQTSMQVLWVTSDWAYLRLGWRQEKALLMPLCCSARAADAVLCCTAYDADAPVLLRRWCRWCGGTRRLC